MHPRSKHWHLIDYAIVRRADLKDVLITRAMRGADCWTDHRMILTKVRMHVRPLTRHGGPKRKTLHCARLSSSDTRDNFRRSLAEKLTDIEQLITSESGMDEKWTSLSTILFDTAA